VEQILDKKCPGGSTENRKQYTVECAGGGKQWNKLIHNTSR